MTNLLTNWWSSFESILSFDSAVSRGPPGSPESKKSFKNIFFPDLVELGILRTGAFAPVAPPLATGLLLDNIIYVFQPQDHRIQEISRPVNKMMEKCYKREYKAGHSLTGQSGGKTEKQPLPLDDVKRIIGEYIVYYVHVL